MKGGPIQWGRINPTADRRRNKEKQLKKMVLPKKK